MCDNQHTCPSHEEMCAKIAEIHTALLGTMDKSGWIGRLASVEAKLGVLIRAICGALAAAGLGLGAYIWTLIVHSKG